MCKHSLRHVAILAVLAALAGCASRSVAPEPPQRLDPDAAIAQADSYSAGGLNAQAYDLLDRAARDNPVSAKPWLRKAQIQFDAGDYPLAIVSAQEAVKRDDKSQEARSIAVVASLRIAIRALTELRGEQNFNSNTQAEAERLAGLLRESLSTELLVPPEPVADAPKKSSRRAVRKPPAAPRAEAAAADAPARPRAEPAATPRGDSGDPFSALRN